MKEDTMKQKLEKLLELLGDRKYSTSTIARSIVLPVQVEETEEILDKLIEIAEQTQNEKEYIAEMNKLEKEILK